MGMLVADQCACVCSVIVGNWIRSIHSHNIGIKVDQPLPGNAGVDPSHAVGGVAGRARKAIIDMPGMLGETRVAYHAIQIVALRAHCVGAIHAEVRSRKQVADQCAGCGSAADFVASLEDMCPSRSMRAIGPQAPEFAVVITVVTIGAQILGSHRAARCNAIQLQHVGQQAGLRQSAGPRMQDRMAGRTGQRKLRYDVQQVA